METKTHQLQAEVNAMLVFEWPHAEALLALDSEDRQARAETIKWCGLNRGDVVVFRTVEVTAEIEMIPEFQYGFNGQKRETITSRSERVLKEDPPRKLWHTKKQGWYWISR